MRSLVLAALLPLMALTGCATAAKVQTAAAALAPVSGDLSAAPTGAYALDPTHTSITWRLSHMGLSTYEARFDKASGTLNFDNVDPTRSTVAVTIDANSVSTNLPTFSEELKTERFLNTAAFPTIAFVSKSVERTGDRTGKVTGDLTFRGVTKPVVLDVVWYGAKEHPFRRVPATGFSASARIKRSDFGFSHLTPVIGDDVEIRIETEFLRQQ